MHDVSDGDGCCEDRKVVKGGMMLIRIVLYIFRLSDGLFCASYHARHFQPENMTLQLCKLAFY